MTVNTNNEEQAAKAFGLQSKIFDKLYQHNPIIQYKRERVRSVVQELIAPNSTVLELNSGTGEDAIWFAQQGHTVHATDISTGMQDILKTKVNALNLQEKISTETISFTDLESLKERKEYDLIFSNFAGLNCTGDLAGVLHSFSSLLKPKGVVVLVILPKFCLWEFLLLLKGKFKTAFRRFFSNTGVRAHIEGTCFRCWYYNPSYVVKNLRQQFSVLKIEGLCTLVPPSYMESFAEKHPKLFSFLKKKENNWKAGWPWRAIGDYYIIALKKH